MPRLFSPTSFWNQPLAADAATHPSSAAWIDLLRREPCGGMGVNARRWTIPVYDMPPGTPRIRIHQRPAPPPGFETTMDGMLFSRSAITYRHGPGFGEVPLPPDAEPDGETDAHLAVIDRERGLIHDFWGARRREDGSWESYTGMVYPLDGDGVFDRARDLPRIRQGDSVHEHGPSRAAGVPAIAGLVFHEEVLAGDIPHKLALATRFNAFQEHVWPAQWTDGQWVGGIPEGSVLQLDPSLDLDGFDLLPGERAVARALQRYGAVSVDLGGATVVYAERLVDGRSKSWEGLFSPHGADRLKRIPLDRYRFLQTGPVVPLGDRPAHLWLYEPLGITTHPLESLAADYRAGRAP
jgi:hypothetical protein